MIEIEFIYPYIFCSVEVDRIKCSTQLRTVNEVTVVCTECEECNVNIEKDQFRCLCFLYSLSQGYPMKYMTEHIID